MPITVLLDENHAMIIWMQAILFYTINLLCVLASSYRFPQY
jgi:hypothetical protein